MYLRRLELYGFKSFPDKTILEFGPGLTAIVGPNGSGKSNLADAVRWALGEQSARMLRGSRMDEVIFSGTDRRKPLSVAEVRLTFDNSDGALPVDYSEVTVARRVSRDGESSYYLNGTPCRLKDVADLMAGTGVGRDSYSLVSQGRIDDILSARGEDRRELLEEAAGITKFRNQRREAVRRLEASERDLERLGDILRELESQVGPLAEQAQEARAYREVASQLRELEVGVLLAILERAQAQLALWEKRRQQLAAALEADEHRLAAVEQSAEAARTELGAREADLEKTRGLLAEQRATERELRARLETGQRSQREAQVQLGAASQRVQAARVRLEEVEAEETASAGHHAESQLQLCSAQAGLAEAADLVASQRQVVMELGAGVEKAKGDVLDALNRVALLKNQVNTRELEARHLEQLFRRRELEVAELAKRLEWREQEAHRLAGELDKMNARKLHCEQQEHQAGSRRAELVRELEAARRETGRSRQRLEALRSRHAVLTEMLSNYEGYGRGPRAVLTGRIPGVLGSVADLFTIEPGYEAAIAAALGGALQYVVTETEDAAEACISYLKKGSGGRATFLPLNLIRPAYLGRADLRALSEIEGTRPALEVVYCDQQVVPVLQYLLGRVVVAPDLDRALAVGRATGMRLKVATLPGEVITPGGAITGGGRAPEAAGLLGRRREVAELEGQVAATVRDLDGWVQRERELARLWEDTETLARELSHELATLKAQRASLAQELEQHRGETQRLVEALSVHRGELEELAGKLREARTEREVAATLIQAAAGEAERVQEMVKERAAEHEQARQRWEAAQEQLAECRAQVARLEQVALGAWEQRQRVQRDAGRARHELEAAAKREQELRELRAALDAELAALEERLHRSAGCAGRLAEELHAVEEARAGILAQLDELERERRGLTRALAQHRSRLHAEELEVARVEAEAGHSRAQLLERYELDVEVAAQSYRPRDPDEAAPAIARLKSRLTAFGAVNLAAVEEYERVNQRYEFLKAQRLDIEEARRDLGRVIQETDRQMRTRFEATFSAVRANFKHLFRRLFGGGSADLILSDPSCPLESGVDIDAQPPGRRLQNLSLLSGGEKALTASALLFAVLSISPSPFCVLDEIEAALDEANTARFVSLLRDFASQTQFVMVTHNKTTMEAADVLYGVTMEESGVSRLISVSLTDVSASG
ncbi:MAG: chromosome segregation protein SMC [Bacillota bacterium]